ncbi:hypothetical protein [Collimonas pratensis]|uniref:hypothetical protein n=1 Tax=Collimonas pratensis TaxID=279113 RepID=UPI0012E80201|nr:hypothetical protein [Collimonas pratensis]
MPIQSSSIIFAFAGLVIMLVSLWAMYKCITLITPGNRALPAWSVWIALIPVIGFFWMLVVIYKIANSLHAENQQRINKIQRIEYGKVIGISSVIFSVIPLIFPQFNLTMMTLACIFWATYMVCICFQIKELKQSSKTI